ncbi:GNAT family N-acetyltransferase [Novipirellula aureliae]|nr:GNAT family N-acetyltransferase [Novipirellula aureliae]
MNIRFITAFETLPLRQRVLRPGRLAAEAHFSGDEAETSFHIGAFATAEPAEEKLPSDSLVCIASVMLQPEQRFGLFDAQRPYQLRGMATDEAFRGQRFGEAVLRACIAECRRRHADWMWCNARVGAIGFYRKQGLTVHPVEFEIPDAGPHQVMYMRIS